MSIELVMLSNHLILCHPFLLLPSVFSSNRTFSSELALCIKWLEYWSFSFAKVLSMNIQSWFPFGGTGLISLLSNGLSRVFSSTTVQFFSAQLSLWSNSHICKTIVLTIRAFVSKVMSLLFNALSRFVIDFLPRSIFDFMALVTIHSDFGAQENKVCHCFLFFPFCLPWSDGTGCLFVILFLISHFFSGA